MDKLANISNSLLLIQDALPQVKSNQDGFRELSKRLNYIFSVVLNDKKSVKHTNFEDAALTFSFIVKRAQRASQRLLQQALGSKEWTSEEIASEIDNIRHDVDAFLSPEDSKSLGSVSNLLRKGRSFLRSTQQDTVKASSIAPQQEERQVSVQETMVKLAKIDISVNAGVPPAVATKTNPQGWSPHIVRRAEDELKDSRVSSAVVLQSDIPQGVAKSPDAILSALAQAQRLTVQLLDVNKKTGSETTSVTLKNVKMGTSLDDIVVKYLRDQHPGLSCPDKIEEQPTEIKVTENVNQYDALAPGGLQIAQDMPILWWWNKYRSFHGDKDPSAGDSTPMHTLSALKGKDSVLFGGVQLSLHRTLRVPDQVGKKSALPPSLGTFPLVPVDKYAQSGKITRSMQTHGGFMMTMTEREAMWISFTLCGDYYCALKVYVGGINAISGKSMLDKSPPADQDYVVVGKQPWLDGVMTQEGVVRQFVGMRLGSGYTVEEQITKKAEFGGIQVDVIPRRQHPTYKTFIHPTTSKAVDVEKTPKELGLPALKFDPQRLHHRARLDKYDEFGDAPWTLEGYRRKTGLLTLKAQYEAPYNPAAITCGWAPPPTTSGSNEPGAVVRPEMGIAAGGIIEQKIFPDNVSVRNYDENKVKRLFIHIATTDMWEHITGTIAPFKPLGPADYQRYGIPWFVLSDGNQGTLSKVSSELQGIKSVTELDAERAALECAKAIDPSQPGPCAKHGTMLVTCVFRPCGHGACDVCIGTAMRTRKCLHCGDAVEKFVGVSEAIVDLVQGDASAAGKEWNVVQIEELANAAVRDGLITVIHPADVVPLYNKRRP